MTLPRPALLAILGGVLILAVFALTRVAAREDSSEAAGSGDPAAEAASAAGGVRSGKLSVRFVAREGDEEAFRAEFGGAFQSNGATAAPSFDFDLSFAGDKEDGDVGVMSTGDRGWVTSGGTAYEVPAEAWQGIATVREEMARLGAQATGEEQPSGPLDLGALLADERRVGTETVDGVETVHTTGRVDVAQALGEIQRAAALQPGALPEEIFDELGGALGDITADTWVGAEDGILRRFVLRFELSVPASQREALGDVRDATIELSVDLTEVNRPQQIEAPAATGDPSELDEERAGLALGIAGGAMLAIDPPPGADRVDPSRLSVSPAGELTATADPATAESGNGLPAGVAKALADKRVVVLALTQDGAEDAAVRDALDAVRGRRGVSVFTDDVMDIADYRRVVGELDIDRAPAVVIVRRDGKAEVIEGYVDAGSLAQQVEDAR